MLTSGNKQRRGEQTKKHILETALKLFSKKSYNNVTVDEIVKVSGTSKGSFYTHFKSKYEIFLEKFKEIDAFYEQFAQSIPADLEAAEKMLRFVDAQMRHIQYELGKDVMSVIYSSALIPNANNYFLNPSRPLYNILFQMVRQGQELQQLRNDMTTEDMVNILSMCMRGVIYDWCMRTDDINLSSESRRFFSIVLNGLKRNG